jgi:putative FmdB family regulatory protein
MPLYEYQCGKCNHRFEKIQKFSDPAPDACPVCGSGPVTRLPSSPAIQFKGTGWYITDYARKSTGGEAAGKGSGEKGSSASGSKDAGSSSRDTGTKPAASTESTVSKGSAGGTSGSSSGGSSGGSSGDGTTT